MSGLRPHAPRRRARGSVASGAMPTVEEYAQLVVRLGADVRPGQDVLIDAQVDAAPFVRALVHEAYRAGAR